MTENLDYFTLFILNFKIKYSEGLWLQIAEKYAKNTDFPDLEYLDLQQKKLSENTDFPDFKSFHLAGTRNFKVMKGL